VRQVRQNGQTSRVGGNPVHGAQSIRVQVSDRAGAATPRAVIETGIVDFVVGAGVCIYNEDAMIGTPFSVLVFRKRIDVFFVSMLCLCQWDSLVSNGKVAKPSQAQ